MVVQRTGTAPPRDLIVRDLPDLLNPGDLLVVNSTRVVPARFVGCRSDSGGRVEGLYIADMPAEAHAPGTNGASSAVSGGGASGGGRDGGYMNGAARAESPLLIWNALVKARRARPGMRVRLSDRAGRPSNVVLELIARASDPASRPPSADGLEHDHAGWLARVEVERGNGACVPVGAGSGAILDAVGLTPLPPYIRQARRRRSLPGGDTTGVQDPVAEDRDRAAYQTVYADRRHPGSVAAPTAGLHFTPGLLEALARRGVFRAEVQLRVGLGTFAPVEVETIEQHPMHAEWCHVPAATAKAIVETRARGGRVIAVGTTSARTLEAFDPADIASAARTPHGLAADTRILITPGHHWKTVDGLMTNLHLPRTTLLAMVAALLEGGADRLRELYAHAVQERYRFYSFGDAMLILP